MESQFLKMQNTIYTKWNELDNAEIVKPFKTFSLTKKKEELETIKPKNEDKSAKVDNEKIMTEIESQLTNMFKNVSKDKEAFKSKKPMNSLVFDSVGEKIYFSFKNIPRTFIYCSKEDKLLGKQYLQQLYFK
jgi:hypothetical protein